MDVSKLGGHNLLATGEIRFIKSDIKTMMGAKPSKMVLDKEPINDHFSNAVETTSAVDASFDFYEARKTGRMDAVNAAAGDKKKDLAMRMYWSEYTDIFTGGSPIGWRNLDMETMYAQAADIYKQIEGSSDSKETKALKCKALENALSIGTGMYKMRMVAEKMKADALEAEAQGKTVDRSSRSKAKFDKLSVMSGTFSHITATFFNNLKNGKGNAVDYGVLVSDAVNKIMHYKHPL